MGIENVTLILMNKQAPTPVKLAKGTIPLSLVDPIFPVLEAKMLIFKKIR